VLFDIVNAVISFFSFDIANLLLDFVLGLLAIRLV
jgi:hypothetical protein